MLSDTQEGYFPRDRSVLRCVMEEKCVGLLYGQRALCIGALKPLNYVGTAAHSHHLETPFKRLAHTGEMFEHVFFGSRAQADRILNAVAGMHGRVNGELPEDAGPHYPKGSRYDAFDPELMLWTVAVMVDSAEWFYRHLVRPLSAVELDGFWADWVHFMELFGLSSDHVPTSWRGFRDYYDAQLAGDDLFLTPEARHMGYASAFEIPMPLYRQPGKRVHDTLMLYSLPPRVRELYDLPITSAQKRFARGVIATHRRLRPSIPDRLALGSCVPEFEMVARTERRRITRGRYTPQALEAERDEAALSA